MTKKIRLRPCNKAGEFLEIQFERYKKVMEESRGKPYDPLNDSILQWELEQERKRQLIYDKIGETYRRKKIENKGLQLDGSIV